MSLICVLIIVVLMLNFESLYCISYGSLLYYLDIF
jgi:hypothetical protein